MKPFIKHFQSEQEYYTPENCYINEISNSPMDAEISIARARVEPGNTTRWHRLKQTSERYVILSGQGRVEIGDLPACDLVYGDVAYIPPDCRQRITNTGKSDLVFLAICSPPFLTENYIDIAEE